MAKEFDAVVFGASGFTGQFVVEEIAISMEMQELYKTNNLKWAIAGRNKEKLATVLREAEKNTNISGLTSIPIIEADVKNYDSILNMCKRTRLVINVAGPFRFYGEPVVKACVEGRAHHVCISGEPQFLEEMQLKYYEEAKKSGVWIVGACGWDSVPADLGATYTKSQANGDLNHVDIFVTVKSKESKGPSLNYGTFESAIYGYAKAHELKDLRKKLFKEVLPFPKTKSSHKPKQVPAMSKVDGISGYCLPFPGSDKSVVRRSEIYKYNKYHERPLACETYFTLPTKISCVAVIFVASVFGAMAKFSWGRSLLKKYPSFFTFGFCSKGGIPRSKLKTMTCKHTIIGYGWNDKLGDIDMHHTDPPTKKIVTEVISPYDPGYFGTAVWVVHSGMTLLFDQAVLPEHGVISPGACFKNSYLMDRLSKRNIVFRVIHKE